MPVGSLAALTGLTLSTNCGLTPEAERYLRLSMSRSFGRVVHATLDQRDPTAPTGRIRAEIVRDERGRMRSSILEPEALKGNAILDDGRTMTVRLDREKLLLVQESPALAEGSLDARVELVRRNYRLSVGAGPRAFDRATVILEARARYRGIESRRYLLDAATGYPLRHDVIGPGGTENLFTVLSLRFADGTRRSTFRPFSRKDRQVITYRPAGHPKPGEAKARIGFEPAVPRELPFGFRISGLALSDMAGLRSVVLRASDGLVKASIYQWATTAADSAIGDGRSQSVGRRAGRTVMVVSDGSALARTRLLDAVLAAIR